MSYYTPWMCGKTPVGRARVVKKIWIPLKTEKHWLGRRRFLSQAGRQLRSLLMWEWVLNSEAAAAYLLSSLLLLPGSGDKHICSNRNSSSLSVSLTQRRLSQTRGGGEIIAEASFSLTESANKYPFRRAGEIMEETGNHCFVVNGQVFRPMCFGGGQHLLQTFLSPEKK